MTSLPLPKRMTVDENGEFVVHSDILPSIINPAEARLGTYSLIYSNALFLKFEYV